jgi:hypothetical protein
MATTSSESPTDNPAANPLSRFSDVRPRPAAWLWRNWLPLGKLAILDGDPGLGKSTLLFDLAARVSHSGVMPDGSSGASGTVILAVATAFWMEPRILQQLAARQDHRQLAVDLAVAPRLFQEAMFRHAEVSKQFGKFGRCDRRAFGETEPKLGHSCEIVGRGGLASP